MLLDSPEALAWDVVPLGLPVPGLQIKIVSDDDREVAPVMLARSSMLGRGLAVWLLAASGFDSRPIPDG